MGWSWGSAARAASRSREASRAAAGQRQPSGQPQPSPSCALLPLLYRPWRRPGPPRRAFALGGAFTNADVGTAEALADSLAENNGQNNNTAAAFTVGPSGENNLAISNTTAVDNNVVSGTALALSSGADIGFVLDVADQAYPNGIPEDAAQAAYLTNNFNALLGQTQKSTADGTIFPLPLPYPVGSPPPPSGSAPPP